jgi:hypothetical protein
VSKSWPITETRTGEKLDWINVDIDKCLVISFRPELADKARLIAAAPELLDALRVMLAEFDCGDVNAGEAHALRTARAAIEASKGGAQP